MKHAYTVTEVAGLLGLSPQATRTLVAAVFDGPRDLLSFQDLVLLRTAKGVPKARIKEALARVRGELPAEAPLSSVTLQQAGKELVVTAAGAKWNATSGQQLFDLGPTQGRGATWLRPVPSRDADALYAEAVRLEESDAPAALLRDADAVAADPHHADAHVNLGRLLHQQGRLREAEAHSVAALVARPTDATACFNLAVVLEDLGRHDDAIAEHVEVDIELQRRAEALHEGDGAAGRLAQSTSTHAPPLLRKQHAQARLQRRRDEVRSSAEREADGDGEREHPLHACAAW